MTVASWGARTSLAGALVASTCCVLPTVLVAVGLGGAVASAVSAVPALTALSAHKAWVFGIVGGTLALSWATMTGRVPTGWARARVCPVGAAPRAVRRLWNVAAALYALSIATVYLAAPIARLVWR